ncbi:MAG: galactokinase family protein [Melioribacter sp.]|uniref:galactokinase n=1 Tax=Rosettibacter primus TaxID=3111523 RepID=UPI00247BAE6B|nr:galactokinase family protein [Melioribacter sp.]
MKIFDEYNTSEQIFEKTLLVKSKFEEAFGDSSNSAITVTPVSMILLGDHTHYNDGILLSTALNKYTIVVLRKRKDNYVNIINLENDRKIEFALNNIPDEQNIDFKYHVGLIKIFKKDNLIQNGFDCVYSSEVPECMGIGKYASLQTGFVSALKKALRLKLSIDELVNLVYQNDLNIIGKISNKTHYYTSLLSKKNKFFFYDLRSKEYNTIPVKNNFEVVVIDTGERIYESLKICNERIEECEVGVKGLRLYIWGIKNLRDVGLDFLIKHYHMLPRKIFNRVLYNVKERERVEKAVASLKENSFDEFGKCIVESHWSMSKDYELSCDYCDYIVSKATENECVIGSKIISCNSLRSTYHIVKKDCSENFINYIQYLFKEKFGRDLVVYKLNFTDGLKEFSSRKFEKVL